MAKGRFDFDQYDGKLYGHPQVGMMGRLFVMNDGTWRIEFTDGSKVSARFDRYPLEATTASADSCWIRIHDPSNEHNSSSIRLSTTSAAEFSDYLEKSGYDFSQLMASGVARAKAVAAAHAPVPGDVEQGHWWAGVPGGVLGSNYHYLGSSSEEDYGDIRVTSDGLAFQAIQGGDALLIRWPGIRDLTFATEAFPRITFGATIWAGGMAGAMPPGTVVRGGGGRVKVFVLSVVGITEGNLLWSFAKPAGLSDVITEWGPVLERLDLMRNQPTASEPPDAS
jgi:hypothetical protein